jgi:hypothetical protein
MGGGKGTIVYSANLVGCLGPRDNVPYAIFNYMCSIIPMILLIKVAIFIKKNAGCVWII